MLLRSKRVLLGSTRVVAVLIALMVITPWAATNPRAAAQLPRLSAASLRQAAASFLAPTADAPVVYTAISDRTTRQKPALPRLGPAGSIFLEPTFATALVRATDAATRPGALNYSYRSPSASHQRAWNTDSTKFYAVSTDGTVVPFAFDPLSAAVSRLPGLGDGGLILDFNRELALQFNVEPEFSVTNANVIYGVSTASNNRTISAYDFSTRTYATVVDLDTVVSGLSGYVGGLAVGGSGADSMLTFFGGPQQDSHFYALYFPVANISSRKLLDTMASTVNGVPTNALLSFHLHSATVDKSGRYVFLYPTSGDLGSPRNASQVYVWDTTTDLFIALTSGGADGGPNALPSGHDAAGYGFSVNHDCCTVSTWDAGQWQLRSLASPLVTTDLIGPVLTPKETYLSDHPSWNNARPGALVPFITATFRYGDNTVAWRAWDDEIIAVQTDAPSAGTVWRFAHHRSAVGTDGNPSAPYFWYEPRPNVAPNGRWAIFTSNWEKTLGTDPRVNTARQDVFVVLLR